MTIVICLLNHGFTRDFFLLFYYFLKKYQKRRQSQANLLNRSRNRKSYHGWYPLLSWKINKTPMVQLERAEKNLFNCRSNILSVSCSHSLNPYRMLTAKRHIPHHYSTCFPPDSLVNGFAVLLSWDCIQIKSKHQRWKFISDMKNLRFRKRRRRKTLNFRPSLGLSLLTSRIHKNLVFIFSVHIYLVALIIFD
jgi:hypothetical protein